MDFTLNLDLDPTGNEQQATMVGKIERAFRDIEAAISEGTGGGGGDLSKLAKTTISPDGTIEPESPQFGNQATLTVVQAGSSSALELVRYGNDNKPASMQISKSRGDGPYDHRGTLAGDRIGRIHFNASRGGAPIGGAPGAGQFIHAGEITVEAEEDASSTLNGLSTRMTFSLYDFVEGNTDYTSRDVMVISSTGRVLFPGTTGVVPAATVELPGWVTLPPNAAEAGGAAIRFTLTDAALLTAPVAGALETDAQGRLHTTDASAVRRRVATLDNVTLVNADTGSSSVVLEQQPGWARVTVTTGPVPVLGTLVRLNFSETLDAVPYAIWSAGNEAATVLSSRMYMSVNTVRLLFAPVASDPGIAANTTFVFYVHYKLVDA